MIVVVLFESYTAGEIPKGALYVGTSERIEGGYKHTDQFYLVPALLGETGGHNSQCSAGITPHTATAPHTESHNGHLQV